MYSDRVGFAIGTGRCGTLFLHELLKSEPCVASSHERNPLNEAFHRYCKWNDLPVDNEGFLWAMQKEIDADLVDHTFSFEASPHLSLSVQELYERFDAKFVCLLRRPDKVVTSFAYKGFYLSPYVQKNNKLAIGCQYPETDKFEYFLARIAPTGDYFVEWNKLTNIGKNAWFWRAYNGKILELLNSIPSNNYRIIKIEEFDYDKYMEVAAFLGIKTRISRQAFSELSESRPHSFPRKRNIENWSNEEVSQYESQVKELATRLGYEYRVAQLVRERIDKPEQILREKPKHGPHFWNLRRYSARLLRKIARRIDCGSEIRKIGMMGRG